MKDPIQDRFNRFKRASEIIGMMLESPNSSLIRRAEDAGCLFEFEYLCEEARAWLDDDAYFDDLAWNMENESVA